MLGFLVFFRDVFLAILMSWAGFGDEPQKAPDREETTKSQTVSVVRAF